MSTRIIDFHVDGNLTRHELRRIVVDKFFEEDPGTGGGALASKYRYNVETLQDGRLVFLTRPAHLKKGFDFIIHVERTRFFSKKGRRRDYPTHNNIFDDLREKKKENPELYERFHEAMSKVYDSTDPDDVLSDHSDFVFEKGYNVEMILKVLKWFFIEQDIRDWNYSGRKMFKNALDIIAQDP